MKKQDVKVELTVVEKFQRISKGLAIQSQYTNSLYVPRLLDFGFGRKAEIDPAAVTLLQVLSAV